MDIRGEERSIWAEMGKKASEGMEEGNARTMPGPKQWTWITLQVESKGRMGVERGLSYLYMDYGERKSRTIPLSK